MKINADSKIEGIVSKDVTRPMLNHVHLDVEKKLAVATDGHRLVVVPVQLDAHDVTGPVGVDAIKMARKLKSKHAHELTIVANGACQIEGGPTFPRPTLDGAKFPPWEQIVPDFKCGDKGTVTVGLNARYLREIADALGSDGAVRITIRLPEDEKDRHGILDPMRVEGGCLDAYAVLMPCRI